jgi:hypothetical protein
MPVTAAQALTKVEQLYARLAARRPEIALADDYYRGKHPLKFATPKWREYHADRYAGFSDNWCGPVANSPAERLRVDGFRLDEDPVISDTEKQLWRDWQLNDMDAQSSQGFLASITSKRSFVLVWGDDDGEPVSTWERADQVIVDYDPARPRVRRAALKSWVEDDVEYATLYLPDQVWKLERDYLPSPTTSADLPPGARGYEFFATASGLQVPMPLTDKGWRPRSGDEPSVITNPLGVVPMVEFPNRPLLGGEPLSDIAGVIPMQDAINLLWAYLFTMADFSAMPARVIMGQEPPKIPILDASGQVVGHREVDIRKLAEDRLLWLTGQNTKIDQFDAASLDAITPTIETCVTHIAAQTRTPPHYLVLGKGMVNVNAEGMKAAETGLVMKVGEEQTFFSPPVRGVFHLYSLVRNDTAAADAARLGTVQWKDAENRSVAQLVDALQKLASIGFPFEWIAEQYGLTQTEIGRLLSMREREAETSPLGTIQRALTGGPADGPPTDTGGDA